MRKPNTLLFMFLLALTQLTGCGKKTNNHSNSGRTRQGTLAECPTGYAMVPNGANSFCVMRYEAKVGSDSKPSSMAANAPWTGTYAEEAKAACVALGAGYDLISNEEWMTVAHDVENQNANWTGGAVGSGCLFRGNNGQPMPWNECGYGDGAGGLDSGENRNARAKMVLSNGEEVYDLAGNVSEWVDWTKGGAFDAAPVGCDQTSTELRDIAAQLNCPLTPSNYSPVNISYGSAEGVGLFVGGNGGYARRGGASWSGTGAGIYALGLERGGSNNDSDNGFRCVYRF